MNRLETAIGGRERLIDLLSTLELAPKEERLLNLLADPASASMGLGAVLRAAGCTPKDMLRLFRDGSTAMAFAEATAVMARELPSVVEDLAEKAVDHLAPCVCTYLPDGSRKDPEPTCEECGGRGFELRRSNIGHQQLMLEAIGMLKKGSGVQVNVQQNTGIAVGSGFFDKFVKATDRATLQVEDGEVVDAEEVDEE